LIRWRVKTQYGSLKEFVILRVAKHDTLCSAQNDDSRRFVVVTNEKWNYTIWRCSPRPNLLARQAGEGVLFPPLLAGEGQGGGNGTGKSMQI